MKFNTFLIFFTIDRNTQNNFPTKLNDLHLSWNLNLKKMQFKNCMVQCDQYTTAHKYVRSMRVRALVWIEWTMSIFL